MKKDTAETKRTRRKNGAGGLVIRNGRISIRWQEDGKFKQEATGLADTPENRAKAEAELAKKTQLGQLLAQDERLALLIRERESLQTKIARLEELAKPRLTLAGLADAFEQSPYRKDCSEKQLAIYLAQLAQFVRWIGDETTPVSAIDDATAARFATYLIQHFAGGTTNKHLNTLTIIWKAIGRSEGLKNPWADIERRRIENHVRRVLTDEEITKILETAKGEIRDLVLIGLHTGLRLGDACRLRWESFKPDGTLEVPTAKTGALVKLPAATLLRDLGREPKKTGFVLPGLAERWTRDNSHVSRSITRTFELAGITTRVKEKGWRSARPDASFHSLRHTFVSKLINSGVPVAFVKELVGHTTEVMTQHYQHADPAKMLEAFQKAGI